MKKDILGLYIHFPFCRRKCLYCDFPSYSGKEALMDEYMAAVKAEIDQVKKLVVEREVDTIFCGGGTPTLFSGQKLEELLTYIKDSFSVSQKAEITIEANPETLDRQKLEILRRAGINRLSIGMQAGQDEHIKKLGRIHTVRDVERSVQWARDLGFKNINLDLMFGLPNQSLDEWMESLDMALGMDIEHLSTYGLILEEGTPFFNLERQGHLNTPSEEVEREMYHRTGPYLQAKGYTQYEISNFAKPGMECRHNLIYWKNGDYIGIGGGAHSSLEGKRWSNYSDISKYMDSINDKGVGKEHGQTIPIEEQRFETIMMGLRLIEGISKLEFRERFGQPLEYYYRDAVEILKKKAMLEENENSIYLTPKGMDFQNQLLLYFMD